MLNIYYKSPEDLLKLVMIVFSISIGVLGILYLYSESTKPKIEKIAESYTLVDLKSEKIQMTISNLEGNSLIGRFFIGTNERQEHSSKSDLSFKYVVETNNGMQLKDFKKEFNTNIFDKKVYFKESKEGQAKLEVYGSFTDSSKKPDYFTKYVFTLPKEDIQEILAKY